MMTCSRVVAAGPEIPACALKVKRVRVVFDDEVKG